jgi:energy-coupling factor transporter transmembrane protein EcfT
MLAQTTTTTNVFGGAVLVVLIIELILVVAFVIAWVKILAKAGYSGAWVILGFIPFVNIVMFFVFAFSRWPALNRPSGFYGAPPSFSPGGLPAAGIPASGRVHSHAVGGAVHHAASARTARGPGHTAELDPARASRAAIQRAAECDAE